MATTGHSGSRTLRQSLPSRRIINRRIFSYSEFRIPSREANRVSYRAWKEGSIKKISRARSLGITRKFARQGSNGSATIEFVLLAIPLFLPLVLFLQTIHIKSQLEFDAQIYARQSVRAYVTSPTEEYIPGRINTITSVFQRTIFQRDKVNSEPDVSFTCQSQPCLTSGSSVTVNVVLRSIDGRSTATASASETVDGWGGP